MNADFGTTNAILAKNGHPQLSGKELRNRIAGKTASGDYGEAFKYVLFFDANGTMEGKNNAGAHNFGAWSINDPDDTISVQWDAGWDATTTRAYDVEGEIKLYDSDTGLWRTTLYNFKYGRQDLVIMSK